MTRSTMKRIHTPAILLAAARLGVTLCNLHALGGYEMMAATRAGVASVGVSPAMTTWIRPAV